MFFQNLTKFHFLPISVILVIVAVNMLNSGEGSLRMNPLGRLLYMTISFSILTHYKKFPCLSLTKKQGNKLGKQCIFIICNDSI